MTRTASERWQEPISRAPGAAAAVGTGEPSAMGSEAQEFPPPFMKVQMRQPDRALPGSGGYLMHLGSAYIPYDAAEVDRLRGHGYEVVRAWWVVPARDWNR